MEVGQFGEKMLCPPSSMISVFTTFLFLIKKLFEEENKQKIANSVKINKIDDPLVKKLIGENAASKLNEEIEIINEV